MKRIGIVGAGFISEAHAAGIKQTNNAQLAGFQSRTRASAEAKAAKFGGKVYETLEEMLQDPSVDIIDICAPSHLHEDLGMKVLAAKKPLLLEKPIAHTKQGAQKLVSKARADGTPFMVCQSLRFMPAYMAIRKVVQEGKLGQVKIAFAARLGQAPNWGDGWYLDPKKSGGVLFNLTLHDYDFFRSIFGAVESVYGVGVKNERDGYEDVVGSLSFKSGVKAVVDGSLAMTPGYPFTMHMRLDGTEGTVEYKYIGGVNLDENATESLLLYKPGQPPITLPGEGEDSFANLIGYFVDCIEKNEPTSLCMPEEMVEVIDVLNGIQRSLETGDAVRL
jgi:predicted dehydrogenase